MMLFQGSHRSGKTGKGKKLKKSQNLIWSAKVKDEQKFDRKSQKMKITDSDRM